MRGHRREMLASTIQAFMSEAMARRLNDPRIEPLTTITRVEVSADCLAAQIFVTVHGSAGTSRRTLQGLQHAGPHLQRLLAGHLQVRQCPHITFALDEAFRQGQETLRRIDANVRERGDVEGEDATLQKDDAEAAGPDAEPV